MSGSGDDEGRKASDGKEQNQLTKLGNQLEFATYCMLSLAKRLVASGLDDSRFNPFCMAEAVSMMDKLIDSIRRGPDNVQAWGGWSGRRYTSEQLIRFILLANKLTESGDIAEVVRVISGVYVPEPMKDFLQDSLTDEVIFPTTISRYLAPVDMSFCLVWRQEWGKYVRNKIGHLRHVGLLSAVQERLVVV